MQMHTKIDAQDDVVLTCGFAPIEELTPASIEKARQEAMKDLERQRGE